MRVKEGKGSGPEKITQQCHLSRLFSMDDSSLSLISNDVELSPTCLCGAQRVSVGFPFISDMPTLHNKDYFLSLLSGCHALVPDSSVVQPQPEKGSKKGIICLSLCLEAAFGSTCLLSLHFEWHKA